MKNAAIFVLSLPLLLMAFVWLPFGAVVVLIAAPLWFLLSTIDWLRGEEFDVRGLLGLLTIGLEIYLDVTGFLPGVLHRIERY